MRPTSKEVYIRSLILKCVVMHSITTPRLQIPLLFSRWSKQEQESFDSDLKKQAEAVTKRLAEVGLWKHASPKEKEFLLSYGSKMNEYSHLAASWRMECIGMLLWALGFIEWPKIDEEINKELLKKVGSKEFMVKPLSLRLEKGISAKRDLAEFWHWRVRTRQLIEKGQKFVPDENMKKAGLYSFDDIVRFSVNHMNEEDKSFKIIDEDCVFLGKPFRELTEEEYSYATSIIMERHFAMNWLCGMATENRWDETPTDT
jgi:hypothetical protein